MERSAELKAQALTVQQCFGRLVQEQREALGFKQDDLAVKANIDQGYLSRLERGKYQPTLIVMLRLAAALSIHPQVLVERVIQKLPEAERKFLLPSGE